MKFFLESRFFVDFFNENFLCTEKMFLNRVGNI